MISWASANLRNQRTATWATIASIADQAASEGRAFTAEEESDWREAMSELERIDAKLIGALAAERESAEAAS